MNYFSKHRQEWITEMLNVYGFINRIHLIRKFGISRPQASMDLATYQEQHSLAVVYDQSEKCYRSTAITHVLARMPKKDRE